MYWESLPNFALDLKLKLAAETFVLHSGPKFMCLVVCFYSYNFGVELELCQKKGMPQNGQSYSHIS